ncbi:luciferase family protein [Streptomyces durhamensis]|uniref:luciferase domain-containing protein n=1 Tax=Streptomyces durhamensis TaxID=68194 RepID=UPI000ABD0648
MPLAQRALEELETWPDLTAAPAGCGTDRALRSPYDEKEMTAVRLVPGSRWVTVHLDCDGDVDLPMSLVSIALQAHQAVCPFVDAPPAVCNFRRVTVLDRDNDLDHTGPPADARGSRGDRPPRGRGHAWRQRATEGRPRADAQP